VICPEERWSEENFELSFEIMESLARMQLIVGDFASCKETTREALHHGKTVEMKIHLLLVDVEVRMAGIEVDDALTTANQALKSLGVVMPRKTNIWHIRSKLLKVKRMLRGKADQDILSLPIIQDCVATSTVKLLMHVCSFCLAKDDMGAGMYAALLATEFTLKAGLTPYSSSAFVFYGIAELSLGNIDRACKYGHLALAMLERMSCKESECTTVGFALAFIQFRKQPFDELIDPLLRAADSGYKRGDVMYATYCSSQCYYMQNYLGTNLTTLEVSMRASYDKVRELGQDGTILWLQPLLQYVLNMQSDDSKWEQISLLSGEIMKEEEYFRQVDEANHPILTVIGALVKAEIACFFDRYSDAAVMFEKIEAAEETIQLSYASLSYCWNAARTHYSLFEHSRKRYHLRKGRRYRRLLQRMVGAECPNAVPLLAFLVVQESMLRRGDMTDAALRDVYDRGIVCLADAKLVHLEGVLNEKAGFAFARRGLRVEAERYFHRALHIYRNDWGAIAKYNWLQEMSRQSLISLPDVAATDPCGTCIIVPL